MALVVRGSKYRQQEVMWETVMLYGVANTCSSRIKVTGLLRVQLARRSRSKLKAKDPDQRAKAKANIPIPVRSP